MLIFKTQQDLELHLSKARQKGLKIGFVPTMGALHEGHLSLIKASKNGNGITICSIFVNPTQFTDNKDLNNYPQPINQDLALLEEINCDIVFVPSIKEMYPEGIDAVTLSYDIGYLDTVLEGDKRPGHFQGVTHIMSTLLKLIQPTNLYMGQKDFQQCLVVKQLIHNNNWNIQFNMMPILREDDGLALSSRNKRLNEFERLKAGLLYQCLISIKAKQKIQDFSILQKESTELMERKGLIVEYIQLADAETLDLLDNFDNSRHMVALIAAQLGNVRLIDNILL